MRSWLPIILLLATLSGCAAPAEELLPIPAEVRGAADVAAVEVAVRRNAATQVAALNARSRGAEPAFEEMLKQSIETSARELGLTSGRRLKLIVEVDEFEVASTLSAAVGGRDRLAGSVFVTDAASDAPLGQLYIDVDRRNGGLVGLVLRGADVPEALAREFAMRAARTIAGRPR